MSIWTLFLLRGPDRVTGARVKEELRPPPPPHTYILSLLIAEGGGGMLNNFHLKSDTSARGLSDSFISISPDEEDRVSISLVNSGDGEPTDMVMEVSHIKPLNPPQSPVLWLHQI